MLLCIPFFSHAKEDSRQFVKLPDRMQQHMLGNMRQHLESVNTILQLLSEQQLDKAADIAEQNLGMTSLNSHNASHMAKFMPPAMRAAGTNMHKAASRFALKAQEGDRDAAYKAFNHVTAACVVCHAGYRIH